MRKNRCYNYFCFNMNCRSYAKKGLVNISKQFVEKNSFRGIARATGHHLDTVRSLASDAAKHCEAVTDFLLKDVKLGTYEIDEFWNFVKKNKKTLPKTFARTLSRVMRTVPLR